MTSPKMLLHRPDSTFNRNNLFGEELKVPFFFFSEFYSFYEDADHYWDFNLPNNIVDNITSQQGSFSGDVIAKRSPTGNGLRVGLKAVINPLPEFGDECPVNPSLCTQGLTVSVLIFCILNHPCSFTVYYYLFIFRFPSISR